MAPTNVIRDGYTETAFISGIEGLHGPLRFSYRPMLPEDTEATETEVNRPGQESKKAVHLIVAQIKNHLTEWDQKEADGSESPRDFETIRRLKYTVLNKVYKIMAGLLAKEPDPDMTAAQTDDFVDSVISEAGGKNPSQEKGEKDSKNSPKG